MADNVDAREYTKNMPTSVFIDGVYVTYRKLALGVNIVHKLKQRLKNALCAYMVPWYYAGMNMQMNVHYPFLSLLTLMRPYALRVVWAFVAMVLATAAFLCIPYAMGHVFDEGFSKQALAQRTDAFVWFLAVSVATAVFSAWRFYLVSWLGEKVVADLRKKLFSNLLRLDITQYEQLKTGEILSRLSTDTSLIQQVVGSSLSIMLRSALQSLGALIMLFVTHAYLATLFVVLIPLLLGPFWVVMRAQRALARQNQDKIASMGAFAGEVLQAISVTKAFSHEPFDADTYNKSVDEVYESSLKRVRRRSLLVIIVMLALTSALMAVFWVGSQLLIAGALSAGELAQFFLYAALLVTGMLSVSEVWGDMMRISAASERVVELCVAQPTITAVEPVCVPPYPLLRPCISFHNIFFAYPSRSDRSVLTGMGFDVEPGTTVALVGASGAGKSTVLQLLLRFYEQQSGDVKIDGYHTKHMPLEYLRSLISMVPQDVVVFSGSIYQNIAYGDPSASKDRVLAAAKLALVDAFVKHLPDGYETQVGERGMRLSGGQKQRLSIARAFLRNAPILLLDEATSSLDAENERLVQQALEQLMVNRTTIVIAHRLATIQKADKIVVIENGTVSASGSHVELMQNSNGYAHLAKLQCMEE